MDRKGSNLVDVEVRKGPWTMEEDLILINYIANHGEGVWNSLAQSAVLKRTGKSCRLRWLNYLRPDVRRDNITPEEQLLIMELHAKWGNRWSKIAKHLAGRTDNEIKNYWRTRIQKQIKQVGTQSCASNSHHHDHTNMDQVSSRHMSSSARLDHMAVVDTYSPPPYTTNLEPQNGHHLQAPPTFPTHHHHHHHHQSNHTTMWSMEDIWSLQLLNAD